MSHYIFSPEWFYGIDSLFETFSFLVAAMIAFYAYRLYKFSNKKSYLYFSYAFMLFSLGLIVKVITNVVIYFRVLESYEFGTLTIIESTFSGSTLIYALGIIIYRFLMLIGLLGIYMVLYKKTSRKDMFLLGYLMGITALLSHYKYFVFHLTVLILLLFIMLFYYKSFMRKKMNTTMLVGASFLFFFISQLFFIFVDFDDAHYVTGEIVQLAGFLLMLIAYIKVMRK